jgi:hypothetical protein
VIKTVVPTIADTGFCAADSRPNAVARRVTHRERCRVYDLGFHRGVSRTDRALTMEPPARHDARRRLTRKARLTPRPPHFVEQMGRPGHAPPRESSIATSFRQRHARRGRQRSHDRVVARRLRARAHGPGRRIANSRPTATALNADHMSPEQVQGKHADPASDIFVRRSSKCSRHLPFEGAPARAPCVASPDAPALAERLPNVDPRGLVAAMSRARTRAPLKDRRRPRRAPFARPGHEDTTRSREYRPGFLATGAAIG